MALFGFGKRKDVKITPFAENDKKRFHDLLCDGVIVENLADFAALLEMYRKLQADHPDKRVLASLDDPGQAVYTSFHAIGKHGLEDTEGHDLSGLGPECFEDGEHLGYLSTEAELPILLANLQKRAADVGFEDACGVLQWEGGSVDGPAFPDALMLDPDGAMLNDLREVHVQFVSVKSAADALAAFPNGYFTCDLDPMQNYAIAKHLEQTHGMALFGVGASNLGFIRSARLDHPQAVALARDIMKIYQGGPGDAVERLASALTGKDWLLLRYSES